MFGQCGHMGRYLVEELRAVPLQCHGYVIDFIWNVLRSALCFGEMLLKI